MGNFDKLDFDANEVEPSTAGGDFEPVPKGDYVATITASEMVPTKAGTGEYLKLEFAILEGEHRNRKLWANLNLDNPSEKAVAIARGELSAICRAVDVFKPSDSFELHGIPLGVTVKHEKYKDKIKERISGYKLASEVSSHGTPADSVEAPW